MSNVPGSLFRKILFWTHLSCGVVAGVFILVMSATGVTLTYEAQMQAAAARGNNVAIAEGQRRLSADELAAAAQATLAEPNPRLSMVIDANPAVPVSFSAGRGTSVLLNPYTGAKIEDAAAGTRGFMSTMRSWHRWLGGDPGSFGAKLIDWSNLLFVFIIASGLYLWFPAVMRWRTVRGLVLFQKKYINGKVRDFNWHHVFGVWMLIPLFLIAASGAVMSFPWANNLVYAAFGEKPPQRGGGGQGGPGAPQGSQPREGGPRGERPRDAGIEAEAAAAAPRASLQQLFDSAVAQGDDWQRITLPLAAARDHVDVTVELKSTARRPPRKTYELSTADASLVGAHDAAPAAAPSRGQQARTWFRFVHTGEQYGVIGQTIAGMASLAACLLVYTGLALAYRRLIRPLFRRAA
jgi:uncharacterized iron-regulated membrane protein